MGYSVETACPSSSSAARSVCQAKVAHFTRTGNSLIPRKTTNSPKLDFPLAFPVTNSWNPLNSCSVSAAVFPLTASVINEAEAVEIANGVRYGLAAYIWTGDSGRSIRLGRDLDVGMIWVNSENNRHLPSPFGGMKASGIGRDGGDYSFDFYMETKNVCIATNDHAIPQLAKS